ncbi:Flp pilus assembly protein CpaB [Paraburkholderia sp. CNPSo 3157]|uniref:Flp pilus assembly protein CpaB n=2 Tax=Paraburkholderia franconis TaxID=2654983 RepID=A0A7X1ND81_9BURK|nr:Flp pilus assembly protein CpaB [Paraburkholderia franconis]
MPNLTRIAAGALIVLAVLLGALAMTLARRPAPAQVAVAQTQPAFPVVVAVRALPAGQPIPADALRIQRLPIDPSGAFADPSLIAGRVPVADIGVQTPVLEAQLSSGIAERIEPGERAVAVRVDEQNAVGNRLRPGNVVDVFFTLKRDGLSVGPTGQAEVERTQARLLLSRVRVLAWGNVTASGAPDTNTPARTAVLAVPLADVDRLVLAEGAGHLMLALRNPRDADALDAAALPAYAGVLKTAASVDASASTRAAAGIALDELSGSSARRASSAGASSGPSKSAPAPARLVARTHDAGGGIEVIRGGRSETVAW